MKESKVKISTEIPAAAHAKFLMQCEARSLAEGRIIRPATAIREALATAGWDITAELVIEDKATSALSAALTKLSKSKKA